MKFVSPPQRGTMWEVIVVGHAGPGHLFEMKRHQLAVSAGMCAA